MRKGRKRWAGKIWSDYATPEDFIRLAATKSLLTGQPYLVRTRDGKEMPLNTWLSNALREHRENEAK